MRFVAFAFMVGLAFPSLSYGDVVVYPNGGEMSGGFGFHMGGNQTALAVGVESMWHNPAGLGVASDNIALAGSEAGRYQEVTLDGETISRFQPGTGFIGISSGPSSGSVGWGWFVSSPKDLDILSQVDTTDSVSSSDVPSRIDTGGWGSFSGGVQREIDSTGHGILRVLATGAGIGIELSPGFRVGMILQWERVEFLDRNESLDTYQVRDSVAGEYYEGVIHATSDYRGMADRYIPIVGVQAELSEYVLLGLQARFPSKTIGGTGSVRIRQSSRADRTSASLPSVNLTDLIVIENSEAPFELRTPLAVSVGLGVVGQTLAYEFNIVHSSGLSRYTVLPVSGSVPPSTSAYSPPSYETRLEPVTAWSMGLSYSLSDAYSVLMGINHAPSPIPANDPVFRRVGLTRLTTGLYSESGPFSGSAGLYYVHAQESRASFPTPTGRENRSRSLSIIQVGICISGGIVF